ncbi:sugar phosphate isomerase/epimerase [Xylanimonas protaetiae]|uniref:Sugar phosphate isomerase/epimerase n=1 Tax=Xylanimonas protaetiae TaxID=2509457 RepID=A0A4P6F8E5_9MICO|nr:sugar phosphate isomerase/epimerase [Xylanimonas protaetiae]
MSRLSLNTATTKHATLAEACDAAATAGLGAVGPWRDRVQEVGAEKAARIVAEAGLRVSSLCRGGFLTAADAAGAAAALEDNRLAIREAATLGTHELILVVGGLPAATAPGGPARPYPPRPSAVGASRTADHVGASRTADHVGTSRTADHVGTSRTADHVGTSRTADHVGTSRTADHVGTSRTADHVGTSRTADHVGLSAAGTPVAGAPAAGTSVAGTSVASADRARDLVATRQRVADRIGELAPYAAEHGVRLVLEPLHPLFAADRAVVSTLGQALDLAAPFDPDVVGVVVDTYHVWWDPDLRTQVARAGAEGRLASYQVCDWVLPLAAEPLNSRGHVGDGYVDFATITRWVAEAGYTGDVEVEIFNEEIWARPPAETVATLADRYARHVLPYL